MKRAIKALLCAACALSLCACSGSGVPIAQNEPSVTLPPASVSYIAPIGDAALEYTAMATLYLPRHDGTGLGALNTEISYSFARPDADSLARALLAATGDGVLSAVGGDVRLSLYGSSAVEISRDVATVNLSATALQLDRQALYLAAQAITSTLCELPQINYVNLLVMDKPVGLDIGNAMPMGALSGSAGQDIAAAYEHLVSRRAEGLSGNVTLYFPITGTSGFMSEARVCSFADREPSNMAVTILRELAAGSKQGLNASVPPLLGDILVSPPSFTASDEAGGLVISLDFDYNLDEMLEAYSLTRAQCLSSICYTLCTYFPNAAGVKFTIGGKPVSTLMLNESFESSVDFENDIARRSDFSSLLYNTCSLYFSDGQGLSTVERPVPYYGRQNPRALLIELAKGPQAGDIGASPAPVIPEGAIGDADILGLAITDQTLLVNFARSFARIGEGFSAEDERMLAYAMVNTLCDNVRVNSVCFFVSGSQPESFTGEIYWKGLFFPMK